MIRVLLVDDHEAILLGLAAALDQTEDIAVVGCAREGAEALRMAQHLRPDVIVMDLSMAGMDGVSSTQQLVTRDPDARVVVLSSFGRVRRMTERGRPGVAGRRLRVPGQGRAGRERRHGDPRRLPRRAATLRESRPRTAAPSRPLTPRICGVSS